MAAVATRPTLANRRSSTGMAPGMAEKKRGSFRRFMSTNFAAATGQSSRKLMLGNNHKKKDDGGEDDGSRHGRDSVSSWGSLSSHSHSSTAFGKKKVRFVTHGRSKKIKPDVVHFPKVDNKEEVWWTAEEMFAIVDDAKRTVDDYTQHCERYLKVLDKVIQRCGSTPSNQPTVAFDMKVIKKFADAKARGLEHHVCPDIVRERQKVIKNVTTTQLTMSSRKPAEREKVLADRYASLSHASKLLAKAMADGDALVAQDLTRQ